MEAETVSDRAVAVDDQFLFRVENRIISTLDMISEECFDKGLDELRAYVARNKANPELRERSWTIVHGRKAR